MRKSTTTRSLFHSRLFASIRGPFDASAHAREKKASVAANARARVWLLFSQSCH
jgi:hypothetical protein